MRVKTFCKEFDIAVLSYSKGHAQFLTIGDVSKTSGVGMKEYALASFTNALSNQLKEISTFTNDGFAVIPSTIAKISENHVVYFSFAFSGDSDGALIFSQNGEVIAMHLETVNEANEVLELQKLSLKDVANSVNSCIKGFSSGYLGLLLHSRKIQEIIFS